MEIETQTSHRSFTVRKRENEAIMGQENRIKRVFHFFLMIGEIQACLCFRGKINSSDERGSIPGAMSLHRLEETQLG